MAVAVPGCCLSIADNSVLWSWTRPGTRSPAQLGMMNRNQFMFACWFISEAVNKQHKEEQRVKTVRGWRWLHHSLCFLKEAQLKLLGEACPCRLLKRRGTELWTQRVTVQSHWRHNSNASAPALDSLFRRPYPQAYGPGASPEVLWATTLG